jgi:hypothetical protein
MPCVYPLHSSPSYLRQANLKRNSFQSFPKPHQSSKVKSLLLSRPIHYAAFSLCLKAHRRYIDRSYQLQKLLVSHPPQLSQRCFKKSSFITKTPKDSQTYLSAPSIPWLGILCIRDENHLSQWVPYGHRYHIRKRQCFRDGIMR